MKSYTDEALYLYSHILRLDAPASRTVEGMGKWLSGDVRTETSRREKEGIRESRVGPHSVPGHSGYWSRFFNYG
jgi:hypothetical protein